MSSTTPNKYTFLTQQINKLNEEIASKQPNERYQRQDSNQNITGSIEEQISDFKTKLLNRSNNKGYAEMKLTTAKFGEPRHIDFYDISPYSKDVSPIRKDDQCSQESSLICDRSDLIQSRMDKVKQALDHYKDYKQEAAMSFTLQNTSRISEVKSTSSCFGGGIGESDAASLECFMEQTPIMVNKYKRGMSNSRKRRSNDKAGSSSRNTNIQQQSKSQNGTSAAATTGTVGVRETVFDYARNNPLRAPLSKSRDRLPTMDTFNGGGGAQQSSPQIIQLRTIQHELNTQEPASQTTTHRAEEQLQQMILSYRGGGGDQKIDEPQPKSYELIHQTNNNQTAASSIKSQYQVPQSSAMDTQRTAIQTAVQTAIHSPKTHRSTLTTREMPSIESAKNTDPPSAADYHTSHNELYSMIADLKCQVERQTRDLQDKDSLLAQLHQEKQILEQQLQISHQQIQTYIQQDQVQTQIILQKEEELYRVQSLLRDQQAPLDKYQQEIECLQRQLQFQLIENEDERARVSELEEVVFVCKDQLNSFDQINVMSQQVIEKLERQVLEQQNELEQAKDTIEMQHQMYYSLVRSLNGTVSEQPVLQFNPLATTTTSTYRTQDEAKHSVQSTIQLRSTIPQQQQPLYDQDPSSLASTMTAFRERSLQNCDQWQLQQQCVMTPAKHPDPLQQQLHQLQTISLQSSLKSLTNQENYQPLQTQPEQFSTAQKRKLIASPLRFGANGGQRNAQRGTLLDKSTTKWTISFNEDTKR